MSGNTIAYDLNGNMEDEKDKGILKINYNILNLPNYFKFNTEYIIRDFVTGEDEIRNVRLDYLYDANGTKLRKKYTYYFSKGKSERFSATDYLNGFQYSINHLNSVSLDFVPTSEGYYDFKNNRYIYNYTDHLGNVRLSYHKDYLGNAYPNDENNYYPFGLRHEGYNNPGGNGSYNYKYNNKELQLETGMYDYGARFYMPDIGRWGVVDPRSSYTHEIYSYVWNNPINLWDPTGMEGEDPDPNKIYGPKKGFLIEEVVISGSRGPVQTKMAGLSLTGAQPLFAPALYGVYLLGEAVFLAVSAYAAADIADKTYEAVKNRDISSEETNEETGSATPDVFPEIEDDTDVNGVPVVDDSGIDTQDDMSIPDPFEPKDKKGIGSRNAKRGDKMGSNKQANKQIDDIANKYKINRKEFGKYVERTKRANGQGGADNFSWRELEELASKFKK